MSKKTSLYGEHVRLGAKMVEFAGWSLPERYGAGVIEEHMAVRRGAGLFDVSHMGEIIIYGRGAAADMQRIFTNDFSKMKSGQIKYTVMCCESGGVLDDMLVFKIEDDLYYIVINASNTASDVEWVQNRLSGDTAMDDVSEETASFALQGPASVEILQKLAGDEIPEAHNIFLQQVDISGVRCTVSRTGYTGEDGFEIYCGSERAVIVWNALLEAGRRYGLVPCGLGARDTLRLEAALPLYGHEMDKTVSPFEAGLGFAVKMKKGDFIGKAALTAAGVPARVRVGLRITGRGIAREGFPVLLGDRAIGRTTSGTFCPFLGCAAAMALVDARAGADIGAKVSVDIRGRLTEAEVVPLPFYKRV